MEKAILLIKSFTSFGGNSHILYDFFLSSFERNDKSCLNLQFLQFSNGEQNFSYLWPWPIRV